MRATPITLTGLALFFGAVSAQSAYDSTCSPPVGQQDVDPNTEPGLVATYGCGQVHDPNSHAGGDQNAATPKDCAIKCAERTPEGPCTWYGGTCYFYNAGAGTQTHTDGVTITVHKDWDKLRAAYKKCDSDLDTCQKGQGGGGNTGPPGGNTGPPGGNTGPPVVDPALTGPKRCPGDGQVFVVGGRQWKAICNKRQKGRVIPGTGKQLSTHEQAIQRCIDFPPCSIASSPNFSTGSSSFYEGPLDLENYNNLVTFEEV